MEVVYSHCAGLDVHKDSVTACVVWAEEKGKKRREERSYGTFTGDLLRLADWLRVRGLLNSAARFASRSDCFFC